MLLWCGRRLTCQVIGGLIAGFMAGGDPSAAAARGSNVGFAKNGHEARRCLR